MTTPTPEITGRTRFGGLLGTPVAHSISPQMYNESFRVLGLDYVYLCFDVGKETLGAAVEGLKAMNAFGFNLTMPDKEAVIPFLDELSDAARLIGAVNTVVNHDGQLTGHNTDGIGYIQSLRESGYEPAGQEMTLLGAGGAATSIAVQAALSGVTALHLFQRKGKSWDKAVQLTDTINRNTPCQASLHELADEAALRDSLERSAVLTNATSVGMAAQEGLSPIPAAVLPEGGLLVSDIIYNPRETALMRLAKEKGCAALNGMYMLLYQGEAAFRIWTGMDMPTAHIREKYFS